MSRRAVPSLESARTPLGRRRFLAGLGAAGIAGALGGWLAALRPGSAGAQAAPPAGTPATSAPPAAAPAMTPPSPPAPEARVEADALLAIIRARVGEHLPAADEPALREELLNSIPGSKALRARVLANSVEPDTVFRASEVEP